MAGAAITVGVNKALDDGVIISALQVIPAGLAEWEYPQLRDFSLEIH